VIREVLAGVTFVGRAFVVNDWYITAYEPIHDANHKVIGMLHVGVPQKGLVDLRRAIMSIVIGKTGYAWVLDGSGRYVISKNGRRDGELLAGQPRLADARIDELLRRAKALDEGEILEHVYIWSNDPERDAPRTKVSYVMYFEPWDWLIGAGTYREEFLATSRQVGEIGGRSNLVLLTVLIMALVATLLTWLVISRGIARPITETNRNLSHTVAALEDRTLEMMTLNQMGDLLQACNSEEETHDVVANACHRLWPQGSGFLALFDEEAGVLRTVGRWGDVDGEPTEFGQDQCWAMRRGKAHPVSDPRVGPVCEHVRRAPCGYVCVPMSAQGRVLGTLYLRPGREECPRGVAMERLIGRYTGQMASVLERYAPSLMAIRLRERLRMQSIRDPLTGLFNRRHMEETLDREVSRAQRHGTTIGVMMIDLDHFKAFNDRYGHEAGDGALRALGELLRQSARGEDIACRLGGEEFVLVLPGISAEHAGRRADQLREKINLERFSDEQGRALRLSASFGVAVFPEHGPTIDKTLRAADVALYQAKAQGRNRVVLARAAGTDQAGSGEHNVASIESLKGKTLAEGD
jgi:diguanylate cyclase (GGDEF)-like protein